MNSGPGAVTPATVTVTMPFIAISGTEATIWPSLQLLTGALKPPTATVLLYWVAPKPLPPMVMTVVGSPVVGDRLVMTGGFVIVNGTELLTNPSLLTVTGTVPGPLAALDGTNAWICVSLQQDNPFGHVAIGAPTPLIKTPL